MADRKDLLEFGQRGVGMFFDMGVEFGWIQLAPRSPALFRGQGVAFDGGQIAVNRAASQ